MLDAAEIKAALTHPIAKLIVLDKIDSTNRYLLALAKQKALNSTVVIAAEQTEGRGQWGRSWQSPRGNLYLSYLWVTPTVPGNLPQHLAEQLKIVIENQGITEISVKWPNDLRWRERKLAGILVETLPGAAVIGLGLNYQSTLALADIQQPFAQLTEIKENIPSLSQWAALWINQLGTYLSHSSPAIC